MPLPVLIDVPVHLGAVLLMARTAIPRQCRPGQAPAGMQTLFDQSQDKFAMVAGEQRWDGWSDSFWDVRSCSILVELRCA